MIITLKDNSVQTTPIKVGDVFYSNEHDSYLQLVNCDLDKYSLIVLDNYNIVYDRGSSNVSKKEVTEFLKKEIYDGKLKHLPQSDYSYNLEIVKL